MINDPRIDPVATLAWKASPYLLPEHNHALESAHSYYFLVFAANCSSLSLVLITVHLEGGELWLPVSSVLKFPIQTNTCFSLLLPGTPKIKINNWEGVNVSGKKSTGKKIWYTRGAQGMDLNSRNGQEGCASRGCELLPRCNFLKCVSGGRWWECKQELFPYKIPGDWRSCLRS